MKSVSVGRISVVITLLLLLASLVIMPSASATSPGRNGRITFMRKDISGFWQVLWQGKTSPIKSS